MDNFGLSASNESATIELFRRLLSKSTEDRIHEIFKKLSQKTDTPYSELGSDTLFTHPSIDKEKGKETYEQLQKHAPNLYLVSLIDLPLYIDQLKTDLTLLRHAEGINDSRYNEYSSKAVNLLLDNINNIYVVKGESDETFSQSWQYVVVGYELLLQIRDFKMDAATSARFSVSFEKFKTHNDKLPVADSNDSCYIATAVYGNINHPEVILLRKFRDYRLNGHPVGRMIVKFYYYLSPRLANNLTNTYIADLVKKAIRLFIRTVVTSKD